MGGKKERGGRGRTVWVAFNNKRKEVEPKFYSVEEEDEATGKKRKTRKEKKQNYFRRVRYIGVYLQKHQKRNYNNFSYVVKMI